MSLATLTQHLAKIHNNMLLATLTQHLATSSLRSYRHNAGAAIHVRLTASRLLLRNSYATRTDARETRAPTHATV